MAIGFPHHLVGGSLFVDGTRVSQAVSSFTMPQLKVRTHQTAGMGVGFDAPGTLEALTGMTATMQGAAPEVEKKIGIQNPVASYRLVGAYTEQGQGAKEYDIQFRGIPAKDAQSNTVGQGFEQSYQFGCVEQLTVISDGETLCDINLKTAKVEIGGTDIYADVKGILGL